MALVKAKNTSPELRVRRLLVDMGYRGYQVHYGELLGKPDIVFTKLKKAIFVNGCFWHRHDCKAGKSMPKTNEDFWKTKFKRNIVRDRECIRWIKKKGWSVMIIWECELKNITAVQKKLGKFIGG